MALVVMAAIAWLPAARSLDWQQAQFGPRLLLLAATSDQVRTFPDSITIHAQIELTEPARWIASTNDKGETFLANHDISFRLLDRPTGQEAYYLVDAQDLPADEPFVEQATILVSGDSVLLVRIPRTNEQAFVEGVAARGGRLSLLTPDPLVLTDPSATPFAYAANQPFAHGDPFIASLLTQLTEPALSDLIAGLSGETPVDLDGSQTTLNTRYTFSSQAANAERYVFHYYATLGLDVHYFPWTYGNFSGRNVIAELPGSEHPERIWLVGGHLDDISDIPYSRAPGADDNATGTAVTMLMAAILKNAQPADTIRFVHFTGEEQGQWGSKRYASALRSSGQQVMGFLDLDMIGWDGNGDRVIELHTGTDAGSNELGTAFIDANSRYEQGLTIERKTTSASRFSDHSPFWDNGFPALLAIENFFDDAIPRDRNPWYHTAGDQLNRVDLNYVARYGRTALATIALLAGVRPVNGTPTPTTTPLQTATATSTSLPVVCQNLLLNGDFEGASGWNFGSTPYPARITTLLAHGGQHSLQLGIPGSANNVRAHSSAFQQVLIPADAGRVTLNFWERPGGGSDGLDYREVLLLDGNYGFLARLDRDSTTGDEQWRERTFALNAYRGRTVTVYFNVYNDGGASQMWNFVDDVALLNCQQTSTATPAPTDTPAPQGTPTPGPERQIFLPHLVNQSPEKTPTPTATPTGNSTIPAPP